MTVKELIKILKGFPSEFPVFLCTDEAGRVAKPPRDAYIDLVHSERGEIIVDGESRRVPEGFVNALVINARNASRKTTRTRETRRTSNKGY